MNARRGECCLQCCCGPSQVRGPVWNPKTLRKVWSANRIQTLCLFTHYPRKPQLGGLGLPIIPTWFERYNPQSVIPILVWFDGPISIQFPKVSPHFSQLCDRLSARASIWRSPAQGSQSRGYGPRFFPRPPISQCRVSGLGSFWKTLLAI